MEFKAVKQPIIGADPLPLLSRICKLKLSDCNIWLRSHPGVITPTRALLNGWTSFIASSCLLNLVIQIGALRNWGHDEHLLILVRKNKGRAMAIVIMLPLLSSAGWCWSLKSLMGQYLFKKAEKSWTFSPSVQRLQFR